MSHAKKCFFQKECENTTKHVAHIFPNSHFFLRIPPDILTTCLSVGPSPNDSTAGSQGANFFHGISP
jgi:hypothetical protein